jgi:hypothetical protein
MFFGVIHPTSIMHNPIKFTILFHDKRSQSCFINKIRGNSFNRRVICDEKCSKSFGVSIRSKLFCFSFISWFTQSATFLNVSGGGETQNNS